MPTHLHVHSHFSLLGATPAVTALAQRAAADGFSHLALTDTNALYGAVRFTRACIAAEVQPVLGMCVTLAPPSKFASAQAFGPGQMILLAQDARGYRSLSRLSSWLQGHPDREQRLQRGLPVDVLAEHRAGVLAIFGGRRSWLGRWLQQGQERHAARWLARLAGIFDENSYLALEWHTPEDDAAVAALLTLSRRFGVPAVAVQPIYTLERAHRERLHLLAAIARNKPLAQVSPQALPHQGDDQVTLHWLNLSEMAERYARWPQALAASDELVARCTPALPDGRPIWPAIITDDGQQLVVSEREATTQQLLATAARAGMKERYGSDAAATIHQRLEKELAAIARHGFAPLFLIVADIVRFARAQQIPVSTRGSVANSMVAYVIGITTVDPVAHELLFERFLNPARQDPPDIDLDFGSRRRDEVLAYVRQRYGEDRVALVCTISQMQPRSAVRETAKAMELPETELAALMKYVPRSRHPGDRSRGKTLAQVAQALSPQDFGGLAGVQRARAVLQRAQDILKQPHHLSVHPGGTVITPGPMTDYAPVQWSAKGLLILQYDHRDAEIIGLTKLDLLGVRALSVLDAAVQWVRRFYAPGFQLEEIPAHDKATAGILSRGETVGVFQCESSGAQRTLRKLRAKSVADLAIANALFKPGPAMGGMAATFVRRYRGQERVRYLHPALEPILKNTKGVLIYQEQILRVATEVAGLSWQEANQLRRGMSKFKPREMDALQQAFISGCQQQSGLTQQQARRLWEQVKAFAGYGFNQGHATAYADVSYRSAYIKAHWPAAYMAARLGERGGFHHPAIYMAEARRLGIEVRPPHVNHSQRRFALAFRQRQPVLWMGLANVRDLRSSAIATIVAARPFHSLGDLLARVPLQHREIEHLIQCGALDGLGASRSALLAQLPGARRGALQLAFDFAGEAIQPESGQQRLAWEQQVLGFPMSQHPLALMQPRAGVHTLTQVMDQPGRMMRVAGVRMPGWTGGEGFYFGDEQTYVLAIPADASVPLPRLWQPVTLAGVWRKDDWGRAWLEVSAEAL